MIEARLPIHEADVALSRAVPINRPLGTDPPHHSSPVWRLRQIDEALAQTAVGAGAHTNGASAADFVDDLAFQRAARRAWLRCGVDPRPLTVLFVTFVGAGGVATIEAALASLRAGLTGFGTVHSLEPPALALVAACDQPTADRLLNTLATSLSETLGATRSAARLAAGHATLDPATDPADTIWHARQAFDAACAAPRSSVVAG